MPAAGYGYSVLVPPSGSTLGIMDQWVRPRAGVDPQSGLARAAVAFPHGAGPASAEARAAQAAFRHTVQRMLQPAPVYRLDPRRLAEAAEIDPSRDGPLTADGYGLAVLLEEIREKHPQRFTEIEAAFCRIAPRYRGLGVQTERSVTKRKSRSRQPDSDGPTARGLVFETCSQRKLPARDVSPGSLLLLALLTLARLPEPPTMLLIENLEQGLYPQWIGDVTGLLKQAVSRPDGQPFPQVIFTTYSPMVLNFFQPEEVTWLARPGNSPDGPAIARPLRDMETVRQQVADGKARLGDLWGQFETYSSRSA